MRKFLLPILLLWSVLMIVDSQTNVNIYDINRVVLERNQGSDSSVISNWVRCEGVVTHIMENGYYIQDAIGDGDITTNDALFVNTETIPTGISVGNHLSVRGVWHHNGLETQLFLDSAEKVLTQQLAVTPTIVIFPDDFTNYSQYVGMTLFFDQTLVVTSNYNWKRYGQLTLSSKRLITPTQATLPGSSEYTALVASNSKDQIIMDDGSNESYPSPLPFADADGTRRTGSKTTGLTAVLRNSSFGYNIVPTETPQFWGNPRPDSVEHLGNYNVKVCTFNLEYYLSSNYGTGYGPANAADAAKQHTKILAACLALDCDVYGLVEVQTGPGAISQLTTALNNATGTKNYAYVYDGSTTNGSYTKVGYIYRQDKLSTIGDVQNLNTGVSNRKKAQGFQLKSNGEKFIYMLLHYKSKSGSGTGNNANTGDGQGSFNGDRVAEAEATVTFINRCKSYFGDDDVLIMGDFNAYPLEDPMQVLYRAGYTNEFFRFDADTAYSYSYQSTVGALDQILTNSTMSSQVSGVSSFHINADEPSFFEYDQTYIANMYRSSDHDPVVVGLQLGAHSGAIYPNYSTNLSIFPNPTTDISTIVNANNYRMRVIDTKGQVIANEFINEREYHFSAREKGIPAGVYILYFIENKVLDPKTIVLKLIIN